MRLNQIFLIPEPIQYIALGFLVKQLVEEYVIHDLIRPAIEYWRWLNVNKASTKAQRRRPKIQW